MQHDTGLRTKDRQALPNGGMKQAPQGVGQLGRAEAPTGKCGPTWLRPGRDESAVKTRDLPVLSLSVK